jgi:hypothetical protein
MSATFTSDSEFCERWLMTWDSRSVGSEFERSSNPFSVWRARRNPEPDCRSGSGSLVNLELDFSPVHLWFGFEPWFRTGPEHHYATSELNAKFTITDSGNAEWLLGCRITRWRKQRVLKLDQEQFLVRILREFNMEFCNSTVTLCQKWRL